jgi:hypothetical protein
MQAFNMATLGGAKAIGRGTQTGSIEVGKQADFCLIDLKTGAFTPLNDALTQLVFCEQGSSVRDVYVGGRKLVDQGRITRIDEEALMLELVERMPTLQGRIRSGQSASEILRPYLEGAYRDCLDDPEMEGMRHSINQFDRSRLGTKPV